MRYFWFLFLILTGIHCTKESSLTSYREISLPTNDILYNIDIDPADHMTIVGGYVWSRGIAITNNGILKELTIDTIADKGQFDLLRTKSDTHMCVGTDGYLFTRDAGQKEWTFHRLSHWDILHNIIETETGYLASGGKSYEHGYIYLIDKQYHIDTTLYFGHEISEVARIAHRKYISVGWGNIQLSYDGGLTWKLLPQQGDFYASCVFTDSLQGWVIGYNGSLLHTATAGETWTEKRHIIRGNGFNAFRKIIKISSEELIITGNDGNLWRSVDHGTIWNKIKLPTKKDLYDIAKKTDGTYILIGSDGYMAEVIF